MTADRRAALVEKMAFAMIDADNALPHSGPDFVVYASAALDLALDHVRAVAIAAAAEVDGGDGKLVEIAMTAVIESFMAKSSEHGK